MILTQSLQVFLSQGQRIVGLTKKGKEFFKLTSTLTEPVQKIVVEDTRIWTGCENIYNLFDNGKDAAYFISRGQINDMIVTNLTRDNDFDTIMGCQDKHIRIVRISQLFAEIPTSHPVTALAHLVLDKDTTLVMRKPGFILFGTSKGSLGLVQITTAGAYDQLWEIDDDDEKRSGITSIALYDINKDNVPEIILGREDGRVEVFKISVDNESAEPVRIFCRDIGQSVRSIEVGVVNTVDYPEIIVAAYSGKIISFTTEPIRSRAVEDSYGRSIQTVNNENRIKSLRKEVEDMRKKLEKEREKVKKQNAGSATATATLLQSLKTPADFPVNTQFDLDAQHAAYSLSIELQMPIDLIILRSPVILDLIEAEASNSVLSVTPPSYMQQTTGEEGGKFMAVFRCQSQERRIALSLRTNEGEFGDLVVTVVGVTASSATATAAAGSGSKVAKVVKYELKPLSLHARVHQLAPHESSRPRHRLRYTGKLLLLLLVLSSLSILDLCWYQSGWRHISYMFYDCCSIKCTYISYLLCCLLIDFCVLRCMHDGLDFGLLFLIRAQLTLILFFHIYTGQISSALGYEWLQALLPDIPPRLEEDANLEPRFFFRNTFTGAVAIVEARRNEIIVESESASTIAIAKETLTRLANYRRLAIEEYITPNDAAISSFFLLIRDKLEYQQQLVQQVQLVDAIHEITQQEPDPAWLTAEYRDILANQEKIRREFKNRDRSLEYLTGVVTDLYVDWNRIQGQDGRSRLPQLQQLVFSGDFAAVVQFFGAATVSRNDGRK